MLVAVALAVAALGLGVLADSVSFGLVADYGGVGSGDFPLYAVFFGLPVLAATLAALLWRDPGRAVVAAWAVCAVPAFPHRGSYVSGASTPGIESSFTDRGPCASEELANPD